MERERSASRRSYSAQLKALVLEQCATPGVSVAKVALSHGINANVVHRWRQLAREGTADRPMSVREFVPVSVPVPARSTQQSSADIRIELRRGATTMAITWPSTAASECAAWMRELLR
jgi:transposase